MDVNLERAFAFWALGLAFGSAYPRKIWLAVILVMATGLGLEWLQEFRPDRHARLSDVTIKIAAALVGLGLAWLASRWTLRRIREP